MTHPFSKMFEKALKMSLPEENLVLKEVKKLHEKGYSSHELHGVLLKLEKSLIQDGDASIVKEAREYIEEFIDT